MFQPPRIERPPSPIPAFRTNAYDRFMERYPSETSPIPLSELVSLVRESIKAGDFGVAKQLYSLGRTNHALFQNSPIFWDKDLSLGTFFLVQLAESRGVQDKSKEMMDFIQTEIPPSSLTSFIAELSLGSILEDFDHEALDQWLFFNDARKLVTITSDVLEEMLVQVYLPHQRFDAVSSLVQKHQKVITDDIWLSIMEFSIVPDYAFNPVQKRWDKLIQVLDDIKFKGVVLGEQFGSALEELFRNNLPSEHVLEYFERSP